MHELAFTSMLSDTLLLHMVLDQGFHGSCSTCSLLPFRCITPWTSETYQAVENVQLRVDSTDCIDTGAKIACIDTGAKRVQAALLLKMIPSYLGRQEALFALQTSLMTHSCMPYLASVVHDSYGSSTSIPSAPNASIDNPFVLQAPGPVDTSEESGNKAQCARLLTLQRIGTCMGWGRSGLCWWPLGSGPVKIVLDISQTDELLQLNSICRFAIIAAGTNASDCKPLFREAFFESEESIVHVPDVAQTLMRGVGQVRCHCQCSNCKSWCTFIRVCSFQQFIGFIRDGFTTQVPELVATAVSNGARTVSLTLVLDITRQHQQLAAASIIAAQWKGGSHRHRAAVKKFPRSMSSPGTAARLRWKVTVQIILGKRKVCNSHCLAGPLPG